jgi:hypothetical protein
MPRRSSPTNDPKRHAEPEGDFPAFLVVASVNKGTIEPGDSARLSSIDIYLMSPTTGSSRFQNSSRKQRED